MKRFDSKALYAAVDEQRQARHLTWQEVAKEIGVSVATIARTQREDAWKLTECWRWSAGSELQSRLLSGRVIDSFAHWFIDELNQSTNESMTIWTNPVNQVNPV